MDGFNYPNFLSEEIDLLINQGQDRFVKQRYGITNIKRTSFEEDEKRTEDLKELIVHTSLTPTGPNGQSIVVNSVMCTLPTEHWFTIWERGIINCPTCNTLIKRGNATLGDTGIDQGIEGIYVEVRPISHVEFDKVINSAFKAPDQTKILRLMYKNQVELIIPEECTLVSYDFRYIKQPVRVSLVNNIGLELSEHTHQEIIDCAIQIALEGIEAKRNNTFTPIINNLNE